MKGRPNSLLSRLREKLWFRPLAMGLLSVALVFLAKAADQGAVADAVTDVSTDTVEALLRVLAASMLVIATFAVGAMVASYASASASATPRSFPLVVSDDVSQNALSAFVGAFIFSIVALSTLMNGVYDKGGRFALFVLTLLVFAGVIMMFVRWVDRIARLGRLGNTIEKGEGAAARAFRARLEAPTLGGVPVQGPIDDGVPVYGEEVGYVQRLDMARLQQCAERANARIRVAALPGTFSMPGRPLAFVIEAADSIDREGIVSCFRVASQRTFDEDPRFGLVVLSEIGSRALSPAVNDPGTAISIINACVRLFVMWEREKPEEGTHEHDRVEVPVLSMHDMFDDAFGAIARDGAGMVEVGVRLQKALHSLSLIGDAEMRDAAQHQARLALEHARHALIVPDELEAVVSAGSAH